MKIQHLRVRVCCFAFSTACVLLLFADAARAAKYWRNGVTTGFWNTATNWSSISPSDTTTSGVPAAGEPVNIVNSDGTARMVTLDVNAPSSGSLGLVSIDLTGPGTTTNTLSIPNNFTLQSGALFVGGYNGSATTNGRGAVTQEAGAVTMIAGTDLGIANGAGSTGNYTLNSTVSGTGTFTANQSEFIGYRGTGTFNQAAGTNTINNPGSIGSFDLGGLSTGNGTYNLSGGQLDCHKSEYIGDAGIGTFTQTGGMNTISDTNLSTMLPNDLVIAYGGTSTGTYTISGGTATIGGDVSVGGRSTAATGGFGTLNVSGTASFNVGGQLFINHHLNSAANFSGGTLQLASLSTDPGDFHWTGGTLKFTQNIGLNGVSAGTGSAFGIALALGSGQTLQTTGDETLGGAGPFALTLNNGSTNTIASLLRVADQSDVTQNAGSTLTANSATVSGGGSPTYVQNGGTTTFATFLRVGAAPSDLATYSLNGGSLTSATLTIASAGTGLFDQVGGNSTVTGNVAIGTTGPASGAFRLSGGSAAIGGNVTVGTSSGANDLSVSGGTLSVGGAIQVFKSSNNSLNLTGGVVNAAAVNLGGDPTRLNWTNGTLNITNSVAWDPAAPSASTGAIFGPQLILDSQRTLSVTGNETIAPGFTMQVNTGGTHNVTGSLAINSGGLLRVDGGTLVVGGLANGGSFDFESGTMNVNVAGANVSTNLVTGSNTTILVSANNVSLGNASSFAGFNHQGTLVVSANHVTLYSAGYARLGVLTTMGGGQINAPNGLTLPSGSNFQGSGLVQARIAGELGSVIEATSSLEMGDSSSAAGFNYAGELRAKQFNVTIDSLAPAGLGNLTTLGNGGSPGTLNSTNGFVVDFDEAITGFGTINSTNTLAKHATINGTVQGTSVAQPITLSGYIKGTGTFTNVSFSGTFSPGLSPTRISAGNLTLAPSSTLEMELGGTTGGSSYDQIGATGALALGGTLDVSLINGFTPASGNSFDLLDWGSLSGAFASINLPTLGAGLTWNTSQLCTTGVISVASTGIPGDYNNNGTVDAADYIVWRKNQGTSHVLPNDPTGGTIGAAQYATWHSHFGQPPGSGAGLSLARSGSTVPEPSSAGIALVFGSAILAGRCGARRVSAGRNTRGPYARQHAQS